MTINDDEKVPNLLNALIKSTPPDVDLTIIGGSALVFWVAQYVDMYPEYFEERIAGTKDIDVIGLASDAKKCAKAWGGELHIPGWNDHTPELAIIILKDPAGGENIQMDFLSTIYGVSKNKALKGRVPLGDGDIYVLSELMVLYNRLHCTMKLKRYENQNAIDQLVNSISVMKCAVKVRLDSDDIKGAAQLMSHVLKIAKSRSLGVRVYTKYGVDLTDIIIDDDRLPEKFREEVPKLILKIQELRIRQKAHFDKFSGVD